MGGTTGLRRRTIRRWLMRNRGTLFLYFALFVFVLGVYHLFSDGDFSFLLVRTAPGPGG